MPIHEFVASCEQPPSMYPHKLRVTCLPSISKVLQATAAPRDLGTGLLAVHPRKKGVACIPSGELCANLFLDRARFLGLRPSPSFEHADFSWLWVHLGVRSPELALTDQDLKRLLFDEIAPDFEVVVQDEARHLQLLAPSCASKIRGPLFRDLAKRPQKMSSVRY